MAWHHPHTPGTIIPQLPGGHPGLSPSNVPLPLTPSGQPMQIVGSQPGYYIPAQQAYGQGYQTMPPGYGQPYASPYPQQMPLYGQPQSQYIVPAPPVYLQQREKHRAKDDNPPLDKFLDGVNYGPVLDQMTATVYDVKLHINPALKHLLEADDTERLAWDVLDSTKEAHLMEGEKAKAWPGRNMAATFPKMDRIFLLSKQLSGPIEVRGTSKSTAVTCGDVLAAIHDYMREKLPRTIYEGLKREKRAKVDATYHYNRNSKAGPDLGTGVRRGDFLEEWTVWDGLEEDEEYIRMALGLGKKKRVKEGDDAEKTPAGRLRQRHMVGHLVLRLEKRLGDEIPVPEETETSGSPQTATNELDSEESEEEVVQRPKKGKGKKKGGHNINYQPMMGYPPGMVPAPPGHAQVMYPPPGMQPGMQPAYMPAQQGQYLMPMQGYGTSPMPQFQQLSPAGYHPGLGTPLHGQRRL